MLWPTSESSRWDSSDEELQHMVLIRIRKIIIKYSFLSRAMDFFIQGTKQETKKVVPL